MCNLKKYKVVFGGCCRNCSSFLQKSLDNLNVYSSNFKESFTIIVENGSLDNTKDILKKNQHVNSFFLFRDEEINHLPYRGLRLEIARNLIIETIKKDPKLINCDLFIMLDLDDVGTYLINNQNILKSIDFLFSNNDVGAVFSNQLGLYYDLWTLRDDNYSKNDLWVEVYKFLFKNKNLNEQFTQESLLHVKKEILDKRILSFEPSHPPILVDSAFGGFGIYKMRHVLMNKRKYEGSQVIEVISKDQKKINIKYQKCEHVNFNLGFKDQNLKLYILPYLINSEFQTYNLNPAGAFYLLATDN